MSNEEIKENMDIIDKVNENKGRGNAMEDWHRSADNLLLKVLRSDGHDELADWFESHPKWYA